MVIPVRRCSTQPRSCRITSAALELIVGLKPAENLTAHALYWTVTKRRFQKIELCKH